jgi:exopolysaccharide production protein ExoQ
MHSFELRRASPSTLTIDKCAIVPILAFSFSIIIMPLMIFATGGPSQTLRSILEPRSEPRIFWPVMAAISIVLAALNRRRLSTLTLPPHIMCLFAYVAFAGVSTLWAFRPELSFIRYVQQLMVLTCIVLPTMLAVRTTDMMRYLFLCFAFAAIVNVFFIPFDSPALVAILKGYPGYFTGKNLLGEFAAIALILALHEMLYPGFRRASGIISAVIATSLIVLANSKTALALAFFAPLLAVLALIIRKRLRISIAIILLTLPACYIVLSGLSHFNMSRLSYMIYGDPTFSGRTIIWEFAVKEIERRPLLGWGYQSFWLVGPDAPSIVDAPGFVKEMPNAHNGYYDTMLEFGYAGYALLLIFVVATLHAIGRVANRDSARAWLLLSLALYVIIHNGLESTWMRAYDLMWVVFVMVAAEIARQWQLSSLKGMAYGRSPLRTAAVRPSPGGPSGNLRRDAAADPLIASRAFHPAAQSPERAN